MKIQTYIPMLILLAIVALGLIFAGNSNRIAETAQDFVGGTVVQAQTEQKSEEGKAMEKESDSRVGKIQKSDEDWRKELSSEEYYILREKGTERAFTGEYYKHKASGTYVCAGCGNELFRSETKYESGSGWPSYYKPVSPENVVTESDRTLGMVRTEVTCARCGGHLGHVFEDGPEPTGLRYCVNSAALEFVSADSSKEIEKSVDSKENEKSK